MFSLAPIKRRDMWSKIVSGFTNWTRFEKVHRPTWIKDCGTVSTVQIAADHDVWRDGSVISRGQSAIKGRPWLDSTHSLNRALLAGLGTDHCIHSCRAVTGTDPQGLDWTHPPRPGETLTYRDCLLRFPEKKKSSRTLFSTIVYDFMVKKF